MATNTNQNKNSDSSNQVDRALRWQEMSLEALHQEAEALGVTLQDQAEKADVIDALLNASTEIPEQAEPGHLISLHSRTDEAKALVLKARNIIVQNEQAGKTHSLFLQNREGNFYKQTNVPGARCNPETLARVLEIASPLPDGSQNALIADLKAHPENYETPLVVRMRRKNADDSYSSYCMIYCKKKQVLAEQAF